MSRTPPRRSRWDHERLRHAAADVLASALRAADPDLLVRAHLRAGPRSLSVAGHSHSWGRGRVVVLAAGKAASRMARAAEEMLGGRLAEALAIDVASSAPLKRTRLLLAGHPVPDRRGLAAAEEVERMLDRLEPRDLLILMLSGGASALLPAPVPGVTLEDKAAVTGLLLRAGASIHELNAVRKHLSRLKGGGLARRAVPARVAALVLSDVAGDEMSTIASGPAAPDPTTFGDALAVLHRHRLMAEAPAAVRRHLEAGAAGEVAETPKPGEALFRRVRSRIIGSNRLSLEAAAREARRQGLRALVLTARLEGEAREAARVLVSVLHECVETGRPVRPPCCLLLGGETTVSVRGEGQGGRNQELVVAAVEPLAEVPGPAVVASLATDGVDGHSDAAGGVADAATRDRARALGLAPAAAFLAASDSRNFLGPLGELIVTGPTGTNVVDVTVLLGGPRMARRPRRRYTDRD